ncbi:MAG: hypothetical protein IJ468_07980 [Lachnospiraceae bacterium]|nr:hypothetical protein [Lachnospiraceae bacterium]
MSSVVLKLIAVITMLIDHAAASCFHIWGLYGIEVPLLDMNLYWFCRLIGRIAFPIYCFLIVEGVHYTRDWKKYALRLGALALLSELPFDFCLHGLQINLGRPDVFGQLMDGLDWKHQNVFFTLLLGMLCVQFLKAGRQLLTGYWAGKKDRTVPDRIRFLLFTVLRYASWIAVTLGLAWVAEHVLCTDYGNGGVIMISIMGLIDEYWEDVAAWLPKWLIRTAICALALWTCCQVLNNEFEMWGMIALLPIALYNGKKGYSNKVLQYGFYLFYPVHLVVLGIIKMIG